MGLPEELRKGHLSKHREAFRRAPRGTPKERDSKGEDNHRWWRYSCRTNESICSFEDPLPLRSHCSDRFDPRWLAVFPGYTAGDFLFSYWATNCWFPLNVTFFTIPGVLWEMQYFQTASGVIQQIWKLLRYFIVTVSSQGHPHNNNCSIDLFIHILFSCSLSKSGDITVRVSANMQCSDTAENTVLRTNGWH